MGLEAVVEEIKAKGQKEAAATNKDAREEVSAILDAAQKRVEEIKLAAEDEVEQQIANLMNQEVSAANLVVKRKILNAQKETLDQVYTATLAAIAGLPADWQHKALNELLRKAVKEIKKGVIHCNERDIPAVQEIIGGLKTLSGFTVGDAVDIDGGIIAESIDGGLQIDYSYRTLLDEVWDSGLKEASDVLYG